MKIFLYDDRIVRNSSVNDIEDATEIFRGYYLIRRTIKDEEQRKNKKEKN